MAKDSKEEEKEKIKEFTKYLQHYKLKLEGNINNADVVVPVIKKLSNVHATAEPLLNSGVYKVVRSISKSSSELSAAAVPLYNKWRDLILTYQNSAKKPNDTQNSIPLRNSASELTQNLDNEAAIIFGNRLTENQKSRNLAFGEVPRNNAHVVDNGIFGESENNTPNKEEFPPLFGTSHVLDIHKPRMFSNHDSYVPVPKVSQKVPSDLKLLTLPVKITESNFQKKDSGSSDDSNAQLIISNSLPSPQSSNSQNSSECTASNNPSPYKVKIPEPYAIEMKEGMFRVVKSHEDLPPDILRVRLLYNKDDMDDNPSKEIKKDRKSKTPKKSENLPKNCKVQNEKSSEKKSFKTKSHNVEKVRKDLKSNLNKTPVKSVKVKTNSPSTNKSAIEKLKPECVAEKKKKENSKVSNAEKKPGPFQQAIKETTNHPNAVPCDIKKEIGHKNCDKKAVNKVLSNDAASNFISSKKERTSVYSGKKTSQDVSSLKNRCIRVLRKNIDGIRNTMRVPYEQLKPVLEYCSASQLRRIEENNRYLLKYTDELWKGFCRKKQYNIKPESHETWRQVYWKYRQDQDRKLKNLTASISASMSKAAPERKIAVVESPENPKNKRMKLSEASDGILKISSKTQSMPLIHKLPKKSNSPIHKVSSKESNSSQKILSKESNPSQKISSKESSHKIQSKESASSHKIPLKESTSSQKIPSKESGPKVSLKESPSSSHKIHKETSSIAHKIPAKESGPKTPLKDSPSSSHKIHKEPSSAAHKIPAKESGPKTPLKDLASSSHKIHKEPSSAAHKIPAKESGPKTPLKDSPSSSHKIHKEPSSAAHKIPAKESGPKTPLKDSPSSSHKAHKESVSTAHKKGVKKANCAPLMSKVKKTVGLLKLHKK